MEILDKSYEEALKIKKNKPLVFVVIEPEYLKFKYETTRNKKKTRQNTDRRCKRQVGGFLNR